MEESAHETSSDALVDGICSDHAPHGPSARSGRVTGRADTFIRLSGPGPADAAGAAPVEYPGRFSGYTNYWQTSAWSWRQHGNLFLIGQPDVARAIAQNKTDIAEELGLPGLVVDEGFLEAWLRSRPAEIEDPGDGDLDGPWRKGTSSSGPSPRVRWAQAPGEGPRAAPTHGPLRRPSGPGRGYREISPSSWPTGRRRLLAVLAEEAGDRRRLEELLAGLRDIVDRYDLHRGWFGAGTLLHSVTCHPGHPLEVIGRGMGLGNDWFTFSGYMDFMMTEQLTAWLGAVGLRDVAIDVGTGKATHSLGSVAYGLPELRRAQDPGHADRGGMAALRQGPRRAMSSGRSTSRHATSSPTTDRSPIDGNKKQIDAENVPFILQTGLIKDEPPAAWSSSPRRGGDGAGTRCGRPSSIGGPSASCRRGESWARRPSSTSSRCCFSTASVWRTVLATPCVSKRPSKATTSSSDWSTSARRPSKDGSKSGPRPGSRLGTKTAEVRLPPGTEQAFSFALAPSAAAMGAVQPVLVEARWKGGRKRTLAALDLPPAVSVHKLLFGRAPEVIYPVSIHNFTNASRYPVEVRVYAKDRPGEPVLVTTQTGTAGWSEHQALEFKLPLRPGSYTVKTTALGVTAETQLGVGEPAGSVTVTPVRRRRRRAPGIPARE